MRSRRWILAAGCLFAAVVSIASGESTRSEQPYWLGEDRGQHATGTIKETWIDVTREELTTLSSDDRRRLMIQIWYPAHPKDNAVRAPYAEDIELYAEYVRKAIEAASSWETNSVFNADLSDAHERYPVLLYNHGGAWPNFSGTFQTEYFASHGYVVVSIGHTGYDGLREFPDGQAYSPIPEEQVSEEERATMSPLEWYEWASNNVDRHARYDTHVKDVTFVLDRLEILAQTPEHPFYQRLDLERIGSLGWSLGGATSFQATIDEPRVKAAVNLDGSLFGRPVEYTGAGGPIMLIEGSHEASRHRRVFDGEADPGEQEREADMDRRVWQMLRLTNPEWYRVVILGGYHGHFADLYLYPGVEPPANGIDPRRAHLIINALTREFFARHLSGNEDTPLLSREESYPEVRLVTNRSEESQLQQ